MNKVLIKGYVLSVSLALVLAVGATCDAAEESLAMATAATQGRPIPSKDELEAGFYQPPNSAKPQTWWHWRDGRINPQAITAELEALQKIGVGGVTMFSVAKYGETGPSVPATSPEWHERVQFALKECNRLGLSFSFHNCPGWTCAGGPWVTPDKAMMQVVCSTHSVSGGETLKLAALPTWPQKGDTYYRDIAVLAFPTPPAWDSVSALPEPKLSNNFGEMDLSCLNSSEDGTAPTKATKAIRTTVSAGQSTWIQFEFPNPVTCRSLKIAGALERDLPDDHRAMVLASEDGIKFHEIIRLSSYISDYGSAGNGSNAGAFTHAIPSTTARFFRLAWDGPAKLILRRVRWSSEPVIDALDSKNGVRCMTIFPEPSLPTEKDAAVDLHRMVDLTSQFDADGNLTWTAPAGKWSVVRVGYRGTGALTSPTPEGARGLVCDVFSREAVSDHFEHYAGELIKDAQKVNASGALEHVLFDSWEVSATPQNWSPVFHGEFQKRRGYDPLQYLPAFAGFIVGDRELTDRFLCDIRQTMSDLLSENLFGQMRELAHKHGMKLAAESAGGSGAGCMVADALQPYLYVDIPMNENIGPIKEGASAAHLTGKPVVAWEAFTAMSWNENPGSLKPFGDRVFCSGVTKFVFHTCAHNPDLDKTSPGPAFGPYGLPFIRGQTWWDMGRPWIDYLSRSQFLLQRGEAAADVLYFYGEEPGGPIPTVLRSNRQKPDEWPALPKGFDFDLLPAEILIKKLSVKDGRLTLPGGPTYRLLVLRDSDKMTPEAAAKIKELVREGATVMGPKPRRSPSLKNYPDCDQVVRGIADEVWGDCDGKTVTHHDFGKGRVFWGTTLQETLDSMKLLPDFSTTGAGIHADIRFIHRREGATEIYFIANTNRGLNLPMENIEAGFRVTGMKPEIWDPVSGTISDVTSFHQENGRTILPLTLAPGGSTFVVFRSPFSASAGAVVRKEPKLKEALALKGPWTVGFAPGWGAPESLTLSALEDWSQRPEPGIKFYSGTAVYRMAFDAPAAAQGSSLFLDLGAVQVIAGVKLNGVDCGIVWTPPFRVDVTKALKPGRNELEVRVANAWINRLLGQQQGPVEGATKQAWTTETSCRFPAGLKPLSSGLLGPVRLLFLGTE